MSSHRLAPRRLAVSLEGLTEELAPATALARVQRVWAQAVGPAISEAASPTSEREGVLTIICSAATWAQELNLMAAGLIARLNEALGEDVVRELRCRTR